ncbi:Lipid A core - O-antigen ligase and related enzymes [Acholeplasma oculi]|nr:O-antigen ligase [Acholeplasma oculi]SUT89074.1 Lipid A core - O-antigen ligase and related enzymes [Acholeplasma oculi]
MFLYLCYTLYEFIKITRGFILRVTIENILKGHIYPILILSISFMIWTYRYFIGADDILNVTFYSLFLLTIPFLLISIFYKNTVYTIPILFGFVFCIGVVDMGLGSFDASVVGFLNVLLVLIGIVIHLIKYKVKIKLKTIGLSLVLAAISFILPELFKPFSLVGSMLGILGFFYLFIFLYYANTIEGNQLHYLMRVFAITGLMLTFQMVSMWVHGFTLWEGTDLIKDFIEIFPRGKESFPGWGNINDLTIHLVLFSCIVIYYLHKYPKSIFPWLYLGFIAFWIYISNARGSMVTITLSALACVIYAFFKRDKRQMINLLISFLLVVLILVIFEPLVTQVMDSFFNTINFDEPDTMLTGRISLWITHEKSAWNIFLKNPLIGSGWYNDLFILSPDENRITVYHSTFFHVLATGGIFGIIVLIYHFIKVYQLFKTHLVYKAVSAFFITYLISQFHGLLDNTQYMVHFSIITYIAFAVIENIPINKPNEREVQSV